MTNHRTIASSARLLTGAYARLLAPCLLALSLLAAPARAERIREVASVQGVRTNQLLGYGLVVGLDGSGDQTTQAPFTAQSVQSMLSQLGIQLPPGVTPQLKNSAAVMVTAQLPAYAQAGQPIDVTVSSGRIPSGATVERVVPNTALDSSTIRLELIQTDFSMARQVAEVINQALPGAEGAVTAQPLDARVIRVQLPADPTQRVAFLAELENLEVASLNPVAKVIVNARTGSVVMNQSVSLMPSAVAHGNLSVTISTTPVVSQPSPFSQGSTVVAEKSDIQIRQESGALMHMQGAARLADVVKALNALGATSQDLIAILQALKAAGSLKAELEII